MSVMLDRLRRFRPMGAPGGAGPVGVPVDTRSGPPAELVGVFEALDGVIDDCRRIREEAEQEATELIAAADREAGQLVADARSQAAAERATAAASIRLTGDAAAEQLRAAAATEADRLVQHGSQQLDGLVSVVLRKLHDEAAVGQAEVA